MAESSFDKFTRITGQVREGVLQPVYLVLGPETFLSSLFIKLMRTAFQKKFGDQGEITLLFGDDVRKREDLEGYLSGGGLFSSTSLIIIQNVGSLDPNSRKLLQQVVDQKKPDMILLLTHSESYRPPQWIAKLGASGQLVPADTPYENEIPRLVHRFAEIRGKKIQPRAVELLMQLTGNNLALIAHEMEKLSLFLGEDVEVITVDVVQDSIAAVPHATFLNLYDAVNQRNATKAVEAFHDIFSRDDSIPFITISLYNHMNKILGFTDHNTFPDNATARAISGSKSPRFQRGIFNATKQYNRTELEDALCELAEIDYQCRQQNIPPMTYFSTWVANHLV